MLLASPESGKRGQPTLPLCRGRQWLIVQGVHDGSLSVQMGADRSVRWGNCGSRRKKINRRDSPLPHEDGTSAHSYQSIVLFDHCKLCCVESAQNGRLRTAARRHAAWAQAAPSLQLLLTASAPCEVYRQESVRNIRAILRSRTARGAYPRQALCDFVIGKCLGR